MYLEINDLGKSFGPKTVVSHMNLSVSEGTILCLLGSSGCGKTTTLQLLGGFLKADEGRILLDGEDITDLEPERRPVSTVFQSYALFPHKTVLENVIYGLKFKGMKRKEAVCRGMEYLELVGLSEYANARIQKISGGQQQRVALARALIVNPKMVLLDEPLSNLDAKLRVRIREEIRQIQRRFGMTMIFVTHDQEEAMALGDQIAIMEEGKVIQHGSPEEIYHHPNSLFVMNFLGKANKFTDQDGREVYVRPEAMHFSENGPLRGKIIKKNFLGAFNQYEVDTGTFLVTVMEDSCHERNEGDLVRIQTDMSRICLFESAQS